MFKTTQNQRGVSLPIVIGLMTVLMLGIVAVNQLVVRQLRSVQRIEASNRAYLAAEAGLEDALYELAAHFPGYQTPDLSDVNVRKIQFDNNADWMAEWAIQSRTGLNDWSGQFKGEDKLMIYLYNDAHSSAVIPGINAINASQMQASDIDALNVSSNFAITFSLPANFIQNGNNLSIDNDNDFGISNFNSGLNEDPENNLDPAACPNSPDDNDCDGQIDEDSEEDVFILWQLSDGNNKVLTALPGCLEDSIPGDEKSEICEKDFNPVDYAVTLNQSNSGENELGQTETIGDFIARSISGGTGNPNAQLNFEFLIVAPMEHVDLAMQKKVRIPYLNYRVQATGLQGANIPYPYYTIQSDGYFRGFKQSITSTVKPKSSTPLLDFTIIQN